MAASEESVSDSFEIVAEVRYSDALFAALAQFRRRAPIALAVYAVVFGLSAAGALTVGGRYVWLATFLAVAAAGLVSLVGWLTFRDFRSAGGRPLRMRYHVCGSGVEIRAAGRGDWVAWDDMWDAGETGRSFVLSPSPGEQYVIPKRCCDKETAAGLRQTLRSGDAGTARG